MLKFHISILLTCEESLRIHLICEELVPFFSDVKNWHTCEELVLNFHKCEESIRNQHTCEKLVPNRHV